MEDENFWTTMSTGLVKDVKDAANKNAVKRRWEQSLLAECGDDELLKQTFCFAIAKADNEAAERLKVAAGKFQNSGDGDGPKQESDVFDLMEVIRDEMANALVNPPGFL